MSKRESDTDTTLSTCCCSICLQAFTYPVELPCKHVFCYLCIKGVTLNNQTRSKRCALCRTDIPDGYFDRPRLVKQVSSDSSVDEESGEHFCWYYKSNASDLWWKYDKNSETEIESAYNLYSIDQTKAQFKLLIAGNLYIIDFKASLQIRSDNRALRRKIKRDKARIEGTIGVAGLKVAKKDDPVDELALNLDSLNI